MTKRTATAAPIATLVAGCTLGAFAPSAAASPLFDLSGDTLGTGGLQARSVPAGSAATFFNPALLADTPTGLRLGFMLLGQQIAISLDGRPGTEFAVPEDIANAGHADASRFDNYPIPTNDLQFGREEEDLVVGFTARPRQEAGTGHEAFTYFGFGLVVKLLDDHLTLGFHGLIPAGDFTRMSAYFNDEREQYFSNSLHPELYGDRLTATSLALGAGVRLTDELSFGAGATLNLEANVESPTYVTDTGDLEKILIDLDSNVNVSLSPHFGLGYMLGGRLRLTATAHAPRQLELGTRFTFLLASGVEQASQFDLVLNYTPWQFGAGAAFEFLADSERAITLVGTLLYATWSDYVDRHGERPSPAYRWADTLSPTLGVRSRWGSVGAFADIAYTPTPVPPQTGRTNYVDNDRLSSSLGSEVSFSVFGAGAALGLQLQAHRLLERHQGKLPTPTRPDGQSAAPFLVKDELPDDAQISGEPIEGAEGLQTNNPGWPGFGSEGWVFASSFYLKVSP